MPRTPEQMLELEQSLAYENAASTIETNCVAADTPDGEDDCRDWFDLDSTDIELEALIAEAAEYLEARGLLIRAAADANIVAIKDEHEGHPLPAAESAGE